MNFGARRPRIESAIPGGLMERLSNELVGGKNKKLLLLRQLSCVELNTLGLLCFKKDKDAIKITRAYYPTHAKDMASYFKDRFPDIMALIGIKDKGINILGDPRCQQLRDDHALFYDETAPYESRIAAARKIRDLQASFPRAKPKSFKDFVFIALGIKWESIEPDIKKFESERANLDKKSAAASQHLDITYTKEFIETLNLIETGSLEELDKISKKLPDKVRIGQINEEDMAKLLDAIMERKQELKKNELEAQKRDVELKRKQEKELEAQKRDEERKQKQQKELDARKLDVERKLKLKKEQEARKQEMERKQMAAKSPSVEHRGSLPVKQKKEEASKIEQHVEKNQTPFNYYAYLRGEI
jgi:hypothetical protein